MALAHDTTTRFPVSGTATVVETTTGDRTISHAGSASAKGVAVTLYVASSSADGVTGITYGGVALTKRQTASDTTEANRVTVWTLPDNTICPTGTQNVVFQGCAATAKVGYVSTVTAATNATAYHAGNAVNTTTSTNPTMNVVTTQTTILYGGVGGGAAAPTSYAAGTNYTLNDTTGVDFGALSSRGQRRTSPVASGTITFDFAYGTSDDWCIAAVALMEQTISVTTSGEYETSLTDPSAGAPDVDTDHSVTIRAWATAGSGVILARLMQGTTEIDSWSQALTGSATNYTHPVISGDVSSITDYNDLRVELKAEGVTGLTVRVSQIFVTFPEGSLTAGEVTGAISWVGSVTGTTLRSGAVTGAVGWVGTVNGAIVCSGAISGGVDWAGSVTGSTVQSGAVSGAISWVGSVTGVADNEGSVSGAIGWAGSVTGSTSHRGAVSGDTQSVRLDDVDIYSRSGSGLGSQPITMAAWIYRSVDTNAYESSLTVYESGSAYLSIGSTSSGDALVGWSGAGSVTPEGGLSLDVGQWYYVVLIYDPVGPSEMWVGTPGDTSLVGPGLETSALSGVSNSASLLIGDDGFNDFFNGRVAQVKIWTAVLTQAELEEEWLLDGIARTDNLWAYYSFRNGPQTNDESGNSRTLTASGVLTSESGPLSSILIEWSGVVTGEIPSIGSNEGDVTGAISWVGIVTGSAIHSGDVSGTTSWVGSVTSSTPHSGSVSGAITWVGAVTGTTDPEGSVSGSIGWAGSVIGETPLDIFAGSIDGAINWVGSVTGARSSQGSVTGAIGWSGIVIGGNLGFVLGAIGWNGIVTGARESRGNVSGAVNWIGTVVGETPAVGIKDGDVTGAISWVGSVTGASDPEGLVSGAIAWIGVVVGQTNNVGSVTGEVTWIGAVVGAVNHSSDIAGNITWTGTVEGSAPLVPMNEGFVSGEIIWNGLVQAIVTVDPGVFMLAAHVFSHIPGVITSNKQKVVSGRTSGITEGRDGG